MKTTKSTQTNCLLFCLLLLLGACKKDAKIVEIEANELHQSVQQLTDVIVHDIFSPPVASRIYAYPSIAAYEIMATENEQYQSLVGQLNGLEEIPRPQNPNVNLRLASVQAFLEIGKTLIFSEDKIEAYIQSWHAKLRTEGIDDDVLANSVDYAQNVATHILDWADKDNYKQTRTFEKFSVHNEAGRWQPTPPAYMEAIEPHWSKIRTFVIDSASQFSPPKPTNFDLDKESQFMNELNVVYEAGKNMTEEQKEIASFWDCNPYVMNIQGHVMFATKKITPGGHWMEIAKLACKTKEATFEESIEAYTMTSLALSDGFISCWDEKYSSNLIRPETVINEHIDESWQPLLQTPPFPEYTSGHSVISGAASTALTKVFGNNFAFLDSLETRFGLKPRKFASFEEAANEAAISRLYGGIHYMPAIENGLKQGQKLGKFIVENVETKVSNRKEIARNE